LTATDQDNLSVADIFVLTINDPDLTLNGSDGADTLTGKTGNDTLDGGAGDDMVFGQAGNDSINGGLEQDYLDGGTENDFIKGDAGDDLLYGKDGNDTLDGGSGNDTLYGGTGNDIYLFGKGDGQDIVWLDYDDNSASKLNILEFKPGITPNEVVATREGVSLLLSIAGTTDTIIVAYYFGGNDDPSDVINPVQQIKFSDGTIWNTEQVMAMALMGNESDQTLTGYATADVISGLGGNDTIYGKGGNDTLDGGMGNDLLIGGAGNDVYLFGKGDGQDNIYTEYYDPVASKFNILQFKSGVMPGEVSITRTDDDALELTIAGTTDRVRVTSYFYNNDPANIYNPIQQIKFSDGSVLSAQQVMVMTLIGNDTSQTIKGFATDDNISALGGMDTVYGAGGNDYLDGGSDRDFLYGDADNDTLIGGEGSDYLYGGFGNDTLLGGDDTFINNLYGESGNDVLAGGAGGDRLNGGAGSDTLDGGAGNDIIYGDIIYGGDADNDTYLFGAGDGNDIIQQDYGSSVSKFNVLQFKQGIIQDDVTVNRQNSDLVLIVKDGTEFASRITITDFFRFDDPSNVYNPIQQIKFNDGAVWELDYLRLAVITGNDTSQSLWGNAAADSITALGGDDWVYGGDGDDTIDGGTGNDYLEGGLGNDIYLFDKGDGQDIIIQDGEMIASKLNILQFKPGIAPGEVLVNRINGTDDLELTIAGTSDKVTLRGYFRVFNSPYYNVDENPVQLVKFSDGTVWDMPTINSKAETNHAPVVAQPLTDLNLAEGAPFTFIIPATTFTDQDTSDSLVYSATLANGNPLLAWLSFDIATRIFSGTPPTSGVINVRVTATDSGNLTVFDDFTLTTSLQNLILTGTASADGLTGGSGNDTLTGAGGNDILKGNAGNDQLDGGTGIDTMTGGTGNDLFIVDSSTDITNENTGEGTDLVQSTATYTLANNVENLTLTGSGSINGTGNTQDNILTGNNAVNTLTGNAGNDRLIGGAGNDTMKGGVGDDSYVIDVATDVITENLNEGIDTIESNITFDMSAIANVENLMLTGSNAINATGNTLNNTIIGNGAANKLTGGTGNDTMRGGTGDDIYVADVMTDMIAENLNEGIDTVETTSTFDITNIANVENLTLTGTGIVNATGNALDNVITGNSAANSLTAAAGNDRLIGGVGNDTMKGGVGNDTFVIDVTTDVITELAGEGTDTIESGITFDMTAIGNVENLTLTGTNAVNGTGNALNNLLTGNAAINTLSGGTGNDTMVGSAGNDTYVIDSTLDVATELLNEGSDLIQSSVTFTLSANLENLTLIGTGLVNGTGNSLDNILTGNGVANTLTGDAGNDRLIGGVGNDTMKGGIGDDVYIIDVATDSITENLNEGIDTIESGITFNMTSITNVEKLLLTGSSVINGTGNALDNVLTGNSAANTLTGAAGNDRLIGGVGNDTMKGGVGNDTYVIDVATDVITELANEGTDTVESSLTFSLTAANVENLTLIGSSSINGTGNTLNNIVVGNSGINILNGGAGNDTLTGGAGADNFLFDAALNATTNKDVLSDFNVVDDTIRIENAIFTKFTTVGALAAGNFVFGSNAVALDSNDYLIYNTTTGTLSYDADGNGAGAKVDFVTLTGIPVLTTADFTIV